MTLANVETRVLNFLGADTADTPWTQAQTYLMINEAYHEYIARFTNAWILGATVSNSAASFVMGVTADGQWIECETLEVWDGLTTDPSTGLAVYKPLKHRNEGEVLFMARSEGASGPPEIYSLALRNRSISATRSQFTVRVYPIPNATFTYRPRVRTWPTADLVAGDNILQQMDDEQGEQLAAIVAARMGLVMKYPPETVKKMLDRLPNQVKAEWDISNTLNWPFSVPRKVGELVEDKVY